MAAAESGACVALRLTVRMCLFGLLTGCAAESAAPATLEEIGEVEGRFTVTDDSVWFAPGDGAVWRLDLATNERTRLLGIDTIAANLTVLEDRAYWTLPDGEGCNAVWVTGYEQFEAVLPDDACWSLIGGFDHTLVVSKRKLRASPFDDTTIATFDLETREVTTLRTFLSQASFRLVDHTLALIETGVARIFDLRSGGVVEIPFPHKPPFSIFPFQDSIAWLENGSLIELHPLGEPLEVARVSVFAKELGRVGGQWIAIDETGELSSDILRIDGGGRVNGWPLDRPVLTSVVHDDTYWFTTSNQEGGPTLWRYGRPR